MANDFWLADYGSGDFFFADISPTAVLSIFRVKFSVEVTNGLCSLGGNYATRN